MLSIERTTKKHIAYVVSHGYPGFPENNNYRLEQNLRHAASGKKAANIPFLEDEFMTQVIISTCCLCRPKLPT